MNKSPSCSFYELHGTSCRSFQFSEASAAKQCVGEQYRCIV